MPKVTPAPHSDPGLTTVAHQLLAHLASLQQVGVGWAGLITETQAACL